MPVGFKNRTDGNVQVAVDAVRAAAVPHAFAGVDVSGSPAILHTRGNPDCHVILRGGRGAPNYGADDVADALAKLRAAGLPERVVIDASHDNSGKDHERQPRVAADIAAQVAAGNGAIVGVMLESFLVGGRQDLERRRAADLRPVDHRRLHGLGHDRPRCSTSSPPRACARSAGASRDEDRRPRRRPDRRLDRPGRARAARARGGRLRPHAGAAATARSSSARSTSPPARSRRRSRAPRRASAARRSARCPSRSSAALAAAGPDCVVTDVGSIKRSWSTAIDDERFVGGHPIAGRRDGRRRARPRRPVPGRGLVPDAAARARAGCCTSACTGS